MRLSSQLSRPNMMPVSLTMSLSPISALTAAVFVAPN
jgi:hypothetical protein